MRLVLLLLLLAASVSAAPDAEFLTVVGESAPTTDVITAANFAANMKLEAGVTFSGILDTELQELSESDIEEKMIVVVDDQTIEIIVGQNAPETHNIVAQRSLSYFKTLGFDATLTLREDVNPAMILIRNERDDEPATTPPPTLPEVVCRGCELAGDCFVTGEVLGSEYCNGVEFVTQKADGESCTASYQCVTTCIDGVCDTVEDEVETAPEAVPEPVEEERGFFSRIWNFLFGWLG